MDQVVPRGLREAVLLAETAVATDLVDLQQLELMELEFDGVLSIYSVGGEILIQRVFVGGNLVFDGCGDDADVASDQLHCRDKRCYVRRDLIVPLRLGDDTDRKVAKFEVGWCTSLG